MNHPGLHVYIWWKSELQMFIASWDSKGLQGKKYIHGACCAVAFPISDLGSFSKYLHSIQYDQMDGMLLIRGRSTFPLKIITSSSRAQLCSNLSIRFLDTEWKHLFQMVTPLERLGIQYIHIVPSGPPPSKFVTV